MQFFIFNSSSCFLAIKHSKYKTYWEHHFIPASGEMGVLSKYFSEELKRRNITFTKAAYSALAISVLGGFIYPKLSSFKTSRKTETTKKENEKKNTDKNPKPAVNRQFLEQLRKLIKVDSPISFTLLFNVI